MAKKSKKQADAHAKLLVWLQLYHTSSNFDILIAVALLDLKVPISLKPDWIQLHVCVTIGWLINTVHHRNTGGTPSLKECRA